MCRYRRRALTSRLEGEKRNENWGRDRRRSGDKEGWRVHDTPNDNVTSGTLIFHYTLVKMSAYSSRCKDEQSVVVEKHCKHSSRLLELIMSNGSTTCMREELKSWTRVWARDALIEVD